MAMTSTMQPTVISRQEELLPFFEELDRDGRFAIDLEFIPEKTFQPVLALIQIATAQTVYILDPLAKLTLHDLWQRIADKRFVKILHAGREDLNIVFQLSSLIPQNIFDTQIAAGFLGFGYPVGYKNLLYQVLNININKSESFTDWLARPLSPQQLQYAYEDVSHLLPLADKLIALLKSQNRLNWALEECLCAFSEETFKSRTYNFTKIKGARALSRQKLAVLQALCDLRTEEATRTNRPLKSILSELCLLELSKWNAEDLSALEKMRGINLDQVRRLEKKIVTTIKTALSMKAEDWPSWPDSEKISEEEFLIGDFLYTVLKVEAYSTKIAPELLATRGEVQKLVAHFKTDCHGEKKLPVLQTWRYELIGQKLLSLLSGKEIQISLSLKGTVPIQISH